MGDGGCTGPVLVPHPIVVPGINFATNSQQIAHGYWPMFEDCVLDRDLSSLIKFDWYATSMHGIYAQPGKPPAHAPRVPRGDPAAQARPIESCIEYGEVGRTTTALLLGTEDDVVGDVDHRGCAAAAKKPTLLTKIVQKFAPLIYNLFITIPSNNKSPETSLIDMQVKVKLQPNGETLYRAILSYTLTKAGDQADLSVLQLKPTLNGEAEILTKSISPAFPNGILALAPNTPHNERSVVDAIVFDVCCAHNWRLVPARFAFVDMDNRSLAAVDLPLLAPEP